MNKVTITGLAVVLMTSTSSLAQTVKYDTTIAKAAAEKAAEKVGDIRSSINFDKAPEVVTKEDLTVKPRDTSFLPTTRKPKENPLPPMTSLFPELDKMVTGSIDTQEKPRRYRKIIVWDKFDRYGNPIK